MDFSAIIIYLLDMTIPVIDVEKTSIKLRQMRETRKIRISRLQALFNMTNPQSIYNWENPGMKTLPRLDNLVVLAKFYDVRIDDLIVLKEETSDGLLFSAPPAPLVLEKDAEDFIRDSASKKVLGALENFYGFSFTVNAGLLKN